MKKKADKDVAMVRDRRGRMWTVTVMPLEQNDQLEYWAALTPEQRIDLVGECVLDGLRVKGKCEVPRMQRVYRVVERPQAPEKHYSRRKTRAT